MDRGNTEGNGAGRPQACKKLTISLTLQGRQQVCPQDRPQGCLQGHLQGGPQGENGLQGENPPQECPPSEGHPQERPQGEHQSQPKEIPGSLAHTANLKWIIFCYEDNINNLKNQLQKKDKKIIDLQEENKHLKSQSKLVSQTTEALEQETSEDLEKTLNVEPQVPQVQLSQLEDSLTETVETQVWKDKFNTLEQKGELREKCWENIIKDVLSEHRAVEEKLEKQLAKTARLELEKQVMAQSQQTHESEVKQLTDQSKNMKEKIDSLTETAETQCQLLSSETQVWKDKFNALEQKSKLRRIFWDKNIKVLSEHKAVEEKLKEQLAETQLKLEKQVLAQSQQTHESEVEQLTDQSKNLKEIDSLIETVETQFWKDKCKALARQSELKLMLWNIEIRNMLSERRAVEEKLEEQQKQILARYQQTYESKVKQLTKKSKNLEDLCLWLKKKTLGTYGRKMQDRVTELDKMKNKMYHDTHPK